jgi:hypothetical protein
MAREIVLNRAVINKISLSRSFKLSTPTPGFNCAYGFDSLQESLPYIKGLHIFFFSFKRLGLSNKLGNRTRII